MENNSIKNIEEQKIQSQDNQTLNKFDISFQNTEKAISLEGKGTVKVLMPV